MKLKQLFRDIAQGVNYYLGRKQTSDKDATASIKTSGLSEEERAAQAAAATTIEDHPDGEISDADLTRLDVGQQAPTGITREQENDAHRSAKKNHTRRNNVQKNIKP